MRKYRCGTKMKPSLQVMKSGGTSVGDATCIRRAAEIVSAAAAQRPVVAVVSAMSGVTNRLVQSAQGAEQGEQDFISPLIDHLRTQHLTALHSLVTDPQSLAKITSEVQNVLDELERLLKA